MWRLIVLVLIVLVRGNAAGLEDYTGIWMDDSGDFGVIVGTGGGILHYDGTIWNPVTSPTTSDLYDVHGLAADDVVASGLGVLLHWDGIDWTIVKNLPGTAYTPVLLTASRIWYGIPDNQFPIIGRCNRNGQGCLGLVAETGSVLELQEAPNGDVVLIGILGDVYQVDDTLTQSPLYDHPVGQTMELTAATVISDSLEGAGVTAYGANVIGIHRLHNGAWQFVDDPSGSIFAMRQSTRGETGIDAVGLNTGGDGLLAQLDSNGMLLTSSPMGASGLGLSDVASVARAAGLDSTKSGVLCNAVELKVLSIVGDDEFSDDLRSCRYLFSVWDEYCGSGGPRNDIRNFIEQFSICEDSLTR